MNEYIGVFKSSNPPDSSLGTGNPRLAAALAQHEQGVRR
jgi:hypothetical protein